MLENKQKFIGQIYTSKSPVRSADDVDDLALNCAEIKALSTNNPIFKEKMELDVDVSKLKTLRNAHQNQEYDLQDKIKNTPIEMVKCVKNIKEVSNDIEVVKANPTSKETFKMEIQGELFTDKKEAGEKILQLFKEKRGVDKIDIGEYRGFKMKMSNIMSVQKIHLQNSKSYSIDMDKSAIGNLTRLDNALEKLPNQLNNLENNLKSLKSELEVAKAEVGKPFAKEGEYQEKSQRLAVVNKEIENIEAKKDTTPTKEEPKKTPSKADER